MVILKILYMQLQCKVNDSFTTLPNDTNMPERFCVTVSATSRTHTTGTWHLESNLVFNLTNYVIIIIYLMWIYIYPYIYHLVYLPTLLTSHASGIMSFFLKHILWIRHHQAFGDKHFQFMVIWKCFHLIFGNFTGFVILEQIALALWWYSTSSFFSY